MRIAIDKGQHDHPALVDLQQFEASLKDPAFGVTKRIRAFVRLVGQVNTGDFATLAAHDVERAIARNADHPCFRIAAIGIEASGVFEYLYESVMDGVFGEPRMTDNAQRDRVEMRRLQFVKSPESRPVAVRAATDQEGKIRIVLIFEQ